MDLINGALSSLHLPGGQLCSTLACPSLPSPPLRAGPARSSPEPRRPCSFPLQVGLQPAPAALLKSPPHPRHSSCPFLAAFGAATAGRLAFSPPKGSSSELWAGRGVGGSENQDNLVPLPQTPPQKTGHGFGALVPGTGKLALLVAGEGSRALASGILLRSGLTRAVAGVCRPWGGQWGKACYCSLPQ